MHAGQASPAAAPEVAVVASVALINRTTSSPGRRIGAAAPQPLGPAPSQCPDRSSPGQGLVEVGDQVGAVLDSDAEPDQTVGDADAAAGLGVDRGMGHPAGMLGQ